MVVSGSDVLNSPYFLKSFKPPNITHERSLKQKKLDLFIEQSLRVSERVMIYRNVKKYFPNAVLEKIDWLDSVGFEPPIQFRKKYPNDYVFRFDKVSCKEIAAYCSTLNKNYQCTKETGTIFCNNAYLKDTVYACQSNCYAQENYVDTVWDDLSNKCILTNVILKSACLNPRGGNENDDRGPPLLWDNLKSTCTMSQSYCEYYGETFDHNTGTCKNPIPVEVVEYVLGKTLTRSIAHPIDTFNRKDIAFNCSYTGIKKRHNKRDTEVEDTDVNRTEIITLSTYLSEKAIKETYKFTRSLKPLVRNNVFLHQAVRISGRYLFKPALILMKVFNGPIGWALLGVDVLNALIEYYDPRNLKGEMSKGDLESVTMFSKELYEKMYYDLTRRDRTDAFFDSLEGIRSRRGGGVSRKRKRIIEDKKEYGYLNEILIDQYMILNSETFIKQNELQLIFHEYLVSASLDLNESNNRNYIREFLIANNKLPQQSGGQLLIQKIKRNWSFYSIVLLFVYITFKMVKNRFFLLNDILSVVILFFCTVLYMCQTFLTKRGTPTQVHTP